MRKGRKKVLKLRGGGRIGKGVGEVVEGKGNISMRGVLQGVISRKVCWGRDMEGRDGGEFDMVLGRVLGMKLKKEWGK